MSVMSGAWRYKMIRELGTGATGSVILCEDCIDHQPVAVKRIDRNSMNARNVLSELLNHSLLLHHHIIEFKEVYLTESHLCIAMEYAQCGTLAETVYKKKGLGELEARWYFQQLIIGLDYCHKRGVVSRDIKLENTLLSGDPSILKICDFGYSKSNEYDSDPKSMVGSPAYVSPEIILAKSNQQYDGKKADVWSSGIFLYAMVFGTFPFGSREKIMTVKKEAKVALIRKLLKSIITDEPVIPSTRRVSPLFHDFIRKILIKNPDHRISIPEILTHPWFLTDLPAGALEMNQMMQKRRSGLQTEDQLRRIVAEASRPRQMSFKNLLSRELGESTSEVEEE